MKQKPFWYEIPKTVKGAGDNIADFVKNSVTIQQSNQKEQENLTSNPETDIIDGVNNSAIIGALLSISSLLFNLFGIVSILGLVFSIKGNTEIHATKDGGRWLTVFGMIIGIVNTAISFITYSVLYSLL